MELELLDQILTSDEPLRLAWMAFDVENNPANLERARRAIKMQVKEGLVKIIFEANLEERVLEVWEIRQVLAEEQNWLMPHADAKHVLSIMNEGAKLV